MVCLCGELGGDVGREGCEKRGEEAEEEESVSQTVQQIVTKVTPKQTNQPRVLPLISSLHNADKTTAGPPIWNIMTTFYFQTYFNHV